MRLLLLTLAVLRATRFVTQDHLGHWWLVQPARRWAVERVQGHTAIHEVDATFHEMADLPDPPAPVKLIKGLDCPFCIGFWIGALAILGHVLLGRTALWRFGVAVFALNEVVGHVSSRIDG